MKTKGGNIKKKILIFLISTCAIITTIGGIMFSYGRKTQEKKFISEFYKDLATYENKDSIIQNNCTYTMLVRLELEYGKFIADRQIAILRGLEDCESRDSSASSEEKYAIWRFYGEKNDFEWKSEIIRITPLNDEWFQVYIDEECYFGNGFPDKAVVYMRIVDDSGFKIDNIHYKLPTEDITNTISTLTIKEKFLFNLISFFKGYVLDKRKLSCGGGIWIMKNGQKGCCTQYGKILIPCKYNSIDFFDGDIFRVKVNNKYGLVDLVGGEIQKCIYDDMGQFINYRAWVKINDKFGYIDRRGGEPSHLYEKVEDFKSYKYNYKTLAKVCNNGKYGYVNTSDDEIVPCIYDKIDDFNYLKHEGYYLAKTCRNNKYGYVDIFGEEIIPCIYDEIEEFNYYEYNERYLTKVRKNGKFGYVGLWNYAIIPCEYDNIRDFCYGFCAVKKDGNWGYVNEYGEEIIECCFDYAGDFGENGTAYVEYNGIDGKINRYGEFSRTYHYSYNTYNPTPLPMEVCDICNGTGLMPISGGGMVLDRQSCLGCGGSGKVPASF